MPKEKIPAERINFDVPPEEKKRFVDYCRSVNRRQVDVLRELIRSLPDPSR